MEQEIFDQIKRLQDISYLGIPLAVMAAGHLVPVPESITLILIGYVASGSTLNIFGVLVAAYIGTILIDVLMYVISRGGSDFALRIANKIDRPLMDRYLNAQEKHLFGLVFFSHFIPGWRFANPVILGITKMPMHKFLSYSLISSMVHTPFYLFLGYFLHNKIVPLVKTVEIGGNVLLKIVIFLALLSLSYFIWEKRKNVYNKNTKDFHAKE